MYFFDSGLKKKFKIENDLSKNRIEKITVITKSGSFVVYEKKKPVLLLVLKKIKKGVKKKKKGGNKKIPKKSYKKIKLIKNLLI